MGRRHTPTTDRGTNAYDGRRDRHDGRDDRRGHDGNRDRRDRHDGRGLLRRSLLENTGQPLLRNRERACEPFGPPFFPSIVPRTRSWHTRGLRLTNARHIADTVLTSLPLRTIHCPFRKFHPAWIRIIGQNHRIIDSNVCDPTRARHVRHRRARHGALASWAAEGSAAPFRSGQPVHQRGVPAVLSENSIRTGFASIVRQNHRIIDSNVCDPTRARHVRHRRARHGALASWAAEGSAAPFRSGQPVHQRGVPAVLSENSIRTGFASIVRQNHRILISDVCDAARSRRVRHRPVQIAVPA